ncbi:SCP2 sterol-binding domain-containing protein, partial [Gammaproteobacteria bacterium AH-315-E17]|nr:SCP2 sterol-binding domain-containing protein [Gammaproteobacteria bacterium AH-315-E17]
CEELFPVIEQIGIWGMHWARSQLSEEDFDLELLMLYLEKSIQPEQLVGKQTVIKFNFKDVDKFNEWWIVVNGNNVDVCVHDPRREIDIYFNVGVRTMCELWMGDITYKKAMQAGKLEMLGSKLLIQNVEEWLKPSIFAGVQPASEII